MFKRVSAGEKVILQSKNVKIGATVGFTEVEILTLDRKLVVFFRICNVNDLFRLPKESILNICLWVVHGNYRYILLFLPSQNILPKLP